MKGVNNVLHRGPQGYWHLLSDFEGFVSGTEIHYCFLFSSYVHFNGQRLAVFLNSFILLQSFLG